MSGSQGPPDEISAAAHARAQARADGDWPRADVLLRQIEAAGWKVIDRRGGFALVPATPPTIETAGVTRFGAATAVPSVLADPPSARTTVELVADDWPADLARMLAGLRAHAPADTHVIVVANAPSADQGARLAAGSPDLAPIGGISPEVVWTSQRLGEAAARNVGLRRARGSVVVIADTSIEPTGDALTPVVEALADPSIAVTGAFGLVSSDLRRFEESAGPDVDAIELYWLGFRREDVEALGPLNEKFIFYRHLDIWWSLALRAGADDGRPPRGARRISLPLERHDHRGWTSLTEAERDRLSRRNFYRVLDRFRERRDLLSGSPPRRSISRDPDRA